MKNIIVALMIGVLLIAGFLLTRPKTKEVNTNNPTVIIPKKTSHFESSTPEHGDVLAGVPVFVVINFNFDLATNSSISITKDGKQYGVGETVIDANRTSMRRSLTTSPADLAPPDGLYTVDYTACWPDQSCHDGIFQFTIDRTKAAEFTDVRGQKEVAVDLKDIQFNPMKIRVNAGTKIIWKNSDSVEHYVNTDNHPAHTYILEQNSDALKTGDQYSFTPPIPGIYPYHCSAHAATMMGGILVE